MSDHTPFSALAAALTQRGLAYAGTEDDGWWKFTGSLSVGEATLGATFRVDPRSRALPRLHVDLPPEAPKVLAHVGPYGYVCYALKGSLVLDIFDVAGQGLACLDRAVKVLELSLRGEMKEDLEDEFWVYWHGAQCLLDIDRAGPGSLAVLFTRDDDEDAGLVLISNDVARAKAKAAALKLKAEVAVGAIAFKVQSKAKPRPLVDGWPPKTVADFLHWQGLLDPRAKVLLERKLLAAIGRDRAAAACVVATPLTHYACLVHFEKPVSGGAANLRQLRERLYRSKVSPMSVYRIDDAYVAERNTPGRPTLAGKKVVLVGCGTIGGFLAELLVKNGAGLGQGELLLVDPDTLGPENIGRHRLGLNRVLENKATGLREELLAGAPTSNIQAAPVAVESIDLRGTDLIIDSTGEEAVGHALTASIARKKQFIPSLSVWVEGPGVAVRALVRAEAKDACTRCMNAADGKRLYPATNEPLPVEFAGHGCESLYVPFPATASVRAACLAAEMASDWAAGNASPRLRTEVVRRGFTPATADSDIPKAASCPACGT